MKGFKLIKEEFIDEINSKAILLEHDKTKARVLKLDNNDQNKTFGIGFKTVQSDDTGICHILEHSVLSGSRKYRTKEPFMDLIKNSLQTFINAMTFDDKTIYPVSSRNDKDFYNLMDVYLDAVFFPEIYNESRIFMQEGWHYELEDKEGPITINGVVYNEMKGAMTSDFSQVADKMARYLYKGSSYSTNAGGEPSDIIKLKEEDLLAYHREKYHPSNSYIFLYGDGKLEEELDHLSQYLDLFDYKEVDKNLIAIKDLDQTIKAEDYYCGEEKEDNDIFVLAYLAGDSKDNLNNLVHSILERALIYEDGAYIKDRIIREGLAREVESIYSVGERNNFSIVCKATNQDKKDRIIEIIDEELDRIKEEGLDEKEEAALIHQMKYEIKSFEDSPHIGVSSYIRAFQNWLYDDDPFKAFKYDHAFKELEENPSIVKDYIKEYLRGERLELLLRPDEKIFERREEKLAERLEEYKKSLSDSQLEEMIESTRDLHDFQLREDTEEAKASLPKLDVKDLKTKLEKIDIKIDGNISSVDTFTSKVLYLDSIIPIEDRENEEILTLALIADLITKLDTEKYSYKELNTEIKMLAYDFSRNLSVYKLDGKDQAFIGLTRALSSETKDIEKALSLFNEVDRTTSFKDSSRIKEILRARISNIKLKAIMEGVSISLSEAAKDIDRYYEIRSLLTGIEGLRFLEELVELDHERLVDKLEKGYEIYKEILDQEAFIHISGEEEDIEKAKSLLEDLGRKSQSPDKNLFQLERKQGRSKAILALTDVNYCLDASIIKNPKASDKVVANLLSNDYLHKNIRAKGGAYGNGIVINDDLVYLYSYRDPNIKETFNVYDQASKWLRSQELGQEDIDNLIIGSYNSFDPNIRPRTRSRLAFLRYIREMEEGKLERDLNQALATSKEDIVDFATRLEEAMENKGRAVLASRSAYEKSNIKLDKEVDL